MSFIISDWNLNPNILWFVKISDIGSEMQIDLYLTQSDAQGDTNKIATDAVSFGTNQSIVLEETDVEYGISYFNEALEYHLKVTGINGDSTKIFQISPFIDIPDINNSIYRTESLIQQKAINEINKHTHIAIRRDIGIVNHIPAMQVGDVARLNSTRRTMDVMTTLEEVNIIGTKDSLINQIGTVEYTDLNYG